MTLRTEDLRKCYSFNISSGSYAIVVMILTVIEVYACIIAEVRRKFQKEMSKNELNRRQNAPLSEHFKPLPEAVKIQKTLASPCWLKGTSQGAQVPADDFSYMRVYEVHYTHVNFQIVLVTFLHWSALLETW